MHYACYDLQSCIAVTKHKATAEEKGRIQHIFICVADSPWILPWPEYHISYQEVWCQILASDEFDIVYKL